MSSFNTGSKQSLATLVNTEDFIKASKNFWVGIPGKSLCNLLEIGAYDQFQSILNPKDWEILQNWLMEGDNPEWKVATVNSSSGQSASMINDHLSKMMDDQTKLASESYIVLEKVSSKNDDETKQTETKQTETKQTETKSTGKGKNPKGEKSKQPETEKTVVKSSPSTLYWSIPLSVPITNSTDLEAINSRIELYKMKELQEKHSTLRFIGKKKNDIDTEYMKLEGKKVIVTVDGFGFDSDKIKAISLKVDNIQLINEDDTKSDFPRDLMHLVQQHITYALAEGTKAVDSVKTITEPSVHGGYYKFVEPLVIEGIVTRVI
jgi:hypothetical protein